MPQAVNRRKMLGGLGCAAAAGALLPVVSMAAPQAWECLWVKVPTLQDHFTWKLDRITKMLVGSPENGFMHEMLQKAIEQAKDAGIPVTHHYGTVCGPRTERISIIDAVWWRVGRDGEYQAAYDPAVWVQDARGSWFMTKDTSDNEKLTLLKVVSEMGEFVYGGSL